MKIKKGDTVKVIAGKDKGKEGTISRVFPKKMQVLVEGVHMVQRHKRATRRGSQGQVVSKPMPIDVSNVALIVKGKPVRVGYSVEGEGDTQKKVRVARPSGAHI
ncbi:MAG TPA: 50S ribosomal protein L24 [Candidatus Paceibacterota bacterium]|nr:50S ribosomal protein L24 [Candidatus Paceibacterota bacterium]